MSMDPGKSIAGVGALLLIIGSFVPFLGIIGFILLMIGLKYLSDYYRDRNIFNNALYGIIFGIIGVAAAAFVIIALVFSGSFLGIGFSPGGDMTGNIVALFGGILIALVVAFIFYILMALYLKRAFDGLANKTNIGMFRTAGLLLLIGAVLTIVLIGLILIFVAWILLTVAFFSMSSSPQSPPAQAAPT